MSISAREQARTASHQAAIDLRANILDEDGEDIGIVWDASIADAASDVWEPLLREIFEAVADILPEDIISAGGLYNWQETLDKVREALT